MADTTTTPNMGMVLPTPLSRVGPQWATDLVTALTAKVDAHDHTAGKGVQLQTSSLTVNADWSFVNFNATTLRAARFTSQGATLVLGSDIGELYNVNGNLFWNNNAGTPVQLTNAGNVVSASALTGPVTGTGRAVTTTYTIDSITPDYYLFGDTTGGAFNVTLPVPTAQRSFVLVDVKGNFGTANLTLVPHGAEKINGFAGNTVLTIPWGVYSIESNGTDWFVQTDSVYRTWTRKTITTGTTTMLGTDLFTAYWCDTTGGAITLNLPTSASALPGRYYFVTDSKLNSSTNAITIVPNGTDTINGVNASIILASPGASFNLMTDGAGAWTAVLMPPVKSSGRVRTVTTTATIDSLGRDYFLNCDTTGGGFTVTLPTPSVGRSLTLTDSKGLFGTGSQQVTLVRSAAELINGVAASKVLWSPWAQYTITSDGTNWFVAGN